MSDLTCPKCNFADKVTRKLLLLAHHAPVYGVDIAEGGRWPYQLAQDECRPAALGQGPLTQFIEGCYCLRCGSGFVPPSLLLNSASDQRVPGNAGRRFRYGRNQHCVYLLGPGDLPAFDDIAQYLWGTAVETGLLGDAPSVHADGWFSMTLFLRSDPDRQYVDVEPVLLVPLVLAIQSPDRGLATKTLAYVKKHAGGKVKGIRHLAWLRHRAAT